jgi:REP element-mobilizing transposase RayT
MLENEKHGGQYPSAEIFQQFGLIERESAGNLINFFKAEGRKAGQGFKLWRVDEKPEAIASREFLRQKIEYIHNNPVKAGFVQQASDYPYSSARSYELDDRSLIEFDRELIV